MWVHRRDADAHKAVMRRQWQPCGGAVVIMSGQCCLFLRVDRLPNEVRCTVEESRLAPQYSETKKKKQKKTGESRKQYSYVECCESRSTAVGRNCAQPIGIIGSAFYSRRLLFDRVHETRIVEDFVTVHKWICVGLMVNCCEIPAGAVRPVEIDLGLLVPRVFDYAAVVVCVCVAAVVAWKGTKQQDLLAVTPLSFSRY